ncbi:MAG: phosphatase PAP2 family protein [Vicinamibacterales bacterium]
MQPLFDVFDWIFATDYWLRQAIGSVRWVPLDAAMGLITYINSWGFVWLFIGGIGAWARPSRGRGVWQMVLAMILASLLSNQVIKPIVGRERPFTVPVAKTGVRVLGERPAGSSFPSSEAAVAVAGAIGLSRAWPAANTLAWVLAILIAFSRVYLGVHYPLDVIAGMAVGVFAGWFVTRGTTWERPIRDEEPEGAAV